MTGHGRPEYPLAPWLEVQVEDGPADHMFDGIFISKKALDEETLANRHGIYEVPKVIDEIADWIRRVVHTRQSASNAND